MPASHIVRTPALSLFLVSILATNAFGWLSRVPGTDQVASYLSSAIEANANGDVAHGGFVSSTQGSQLSAFLVDGATGDELWRYLEGPGSNAFLNSLATDSSGDVVIAGAVTGDWIVRKLDAATGAVLWSDDRSGGSARAFDVEVDPADDVFVVGNLLDGGAGSRDLHVVKLDGATGAELWSVSIDGGINGDDALDVELDGAGGIFVAGRVGLDLAVIKFDAATGAELWRHTEANRPVPQNSILAVDAAGDPIMAGFQGLEMLILKLDGATGAEEWRYLNGGTDAGRQDFPNAVAVDGSNDVFVAGILDEGGSPEKFFVGKLDGATGNELWTYERNPFFDRDHEARAIVVDSLGDAYAAGVLQYEDDGGHGEFGIIVRLDGATGVPVWLHRHVGTRLRSSSPGNKEFLELALDASGFLLASGRFNEKNGVNVPGAVKLDVSDGSMASVDGTKLIVKDKGDPAKRSISFAAKSIVVQSPPPGAVGNPAVAGATFRLWNPSTLEEASFFLPPGPNWKGLGKPAGTLGWKYLDKFGAAGPCIKATINSVKQMKVTCKGKLGNIPFTLDEASQGSLAASLQFGIESPQCVLFGGVVLKDEPGIFKAKSAPPVPVCP